MRTSPINRVIDHFRRAVLLPDGAGFGDSELLGSFIERRDETALAALVKRHGSMVWGVCRRLLSHHDAEDAFQAAFPVLVRCPCRRSANRIRDGRRARTRIVTFNRQKK